METSTFNVLSGLSRSVQNFDPIGSYNQGRQMREEWDQSGRLNELRQKLPMMIADMKVKNPMLTEKLDSLAEVAKADPMGAYKMLVQLSDDKMNTQNNAEVSRNVQIMQNAKLAGDEILANSYGKPLSELAQNKEDYKKAFDSYNSAFSGAINAGGSTGIITHMGRMVNFNEALQDYEKRKQNAEKSGVDLETARLNRDSAQFGYNQNKELAPIKKAEAQQGLSNAKLEGDLKTMTKEDKGVEKNLKKDGFIMAMDALVSKMNALANHFRNLFSKDPQEVKSAKNSITKLYARSSSDEALSGGEYGQAVGSTGFNEILNKISAGALDLSQMNDNQAINASTDLYNQLKDGLFSVKSRSSKVFGSQLNPSLNPSSLVRGYQAPKQDSVPNATTPPKNGVIRVGEYYVKYENGKAVGKKRVNQ